MNEGSPNSRNSSTATCSATEATKPIRRRRGVPEALWPGRSAPRNSCCSTGDHRAIG
jgi:hypothetical protein